MKFIYGIKTPTNDGIYWYADSAHQAWNSFFNTHTNRLGIYDMIQVYKENGYKCVMVEIDNTKWIDCND